MFLSARIHLFLYVTRLNMMLSRLVDTIWSNIVHRRLFGSFSFLLVDQHLFHWLYKYCIEEYLVDIFTVEFSAAVRIAVIKAIIRLLSMPDGNISRDAKKLDGYSSISSLIIHPMLTILWVEFRFWSIVKDTFCRDEIFLRILWRASWYTGWLMYCFSKS